MRLSRWVSVAFVVALTACAATSDDPADAIGAAAANDDPVSLCVNVSRPALLARAFRGRVTPPSRGAGVDFTGGVGWPGLTIDGAQRALCLATQQSGSSGEPDDVYRWGDRGELALSVSRATGAVTKVAFRPGYTGAITTSADAAAYTVRIGEPIARAGVPVSADWTSTTSDVELDAIYRALLRTFAPALVAGEGSCVASGRCARAADATGVTLSFAGVHLRVHLSGGIVDGFAMIPKAPALDR